MIENTFEQHLRSVLPEITEDQVKLVMVLQQKCHAKALEAQGDLEKINEVVNDIIGREVRSVLGPVQFRKLFGDFETLTLIDPE